MVLEDERSEAGLFGGWVAASLARDPHGTIARMVRVFPPSRLRQAREALARNPGDLAPDACAEPDQPGATWFCDWCGRADPPRGLSTTYPPPLPASAFEVVPGSLELRPAPAPGA
jgi:hypothetical protein